MSYTDVSLCSKALLKIGAQTITSFEDGTAESEVAANLYPLTRDSLLASYPWSFAVAQKRLGHLDLTPVADFKRAYQLPADFLRIISAGSGTRGRGAEYRIYENKIYTDSEELIITYICRVDESIFPTFFNEALVAALAFEFCLPLTESTSRAEFLQKKAEDVLKQARLIDAQQATPLKFEDFSLIEARQ